MNERTISVDASSKKVEKKRRTTKYKRLFLIALLTFLTACEPIRESISRASIDEGRKEGNQPAAPIELRPVYEIAQDSTVKLHLRFEDLDIVDFEGTGGIFKLPQEMMNDNTHEYWLIITVKHNMYTTNAGQTTPLKAFSLSQNGKSVGIVRERNNFISKDDDGDMSIILFRTKKGVFLFPNSIPYTDQLFDVANTSMPAVVVGYPQSVVDAGGGKVSQAYAVRVNPGFPDDPNWAQITVNTGEIPYTGMSGGLVWNHDKKAVGVISEGNMVEMFIVTNLREKVTVLLQQAIEEMKQR